MRIFISWLLFFLGTTTLTAQMQVTIGDSLIGEKGIVSQQIEDGTIWVVGMSQIGPEGGVDVMAVRMDTLGNLLTSYFYYGTPYLDYPNNMIYQNGVLTIAGETHNNGNVDGFILKIDTTGTLLSFQNYGQANHSEQFYDIKATQDGGFVVAGFESSPNLVGNNFLLSKFDAQGQQEWMKIHDLGRNDIGVTVVENPNGGFIVAGDQAQFSNNYNVAVIGCDTAGNLLWNKVIFNAFNGGCKNMIAHNNEVIIVGEMATFASSSFDIYFIRIDWQGNTLWQGTIPKTNNGDAAFDVVAKGPNEFYLTGYYYNSTTSNTDLFVMALDSQGTILNERFFGGTNFDMGYDIKLNPNGGFLITGFSTVGNQNQMYVIYDYFTTPTNTQQISKYETQPFLFPNPTTGRLEIPIALQNYQIEVVDVMGKLLQQNKNATHLNLQALANGIYYIAFRNEEGRLMFQQKVVKQ